MRMAPWLIGLMFSVMASAAAAADQSGADEFLLKSADSFQHMIDFIVTMNLGGFAAIGYIVKDSELAPEHMRWWQSGCASLAFLCCALSLLFAYLSYADLLAMTGNKTFAYDKLDYYPWSAVLLLAAAVFIFGTLVVSTIWKAP